MKTLNRVVIASLALATLPSWAQTLDIHGAFAQGFVYTDGNNYLGDSTHGSTDYFEVAVNGRHSVTPNLLASAQVMARKAGPAADGKLRVDFAQLDWQIFGNASRDFGLRVGRVKNPFGFYNDSRDVVFARPGILLPSAVYFEGSGVRDLLFSADGGQFYGHFSLAGNPGEFTVGRALEYQATEEFKRAFAQGQLPGDVDIKSLTYAQWLQDWAGGGWRSGLSFIGADLKFAPDDPQLAPFASVDFSSRNYVLSLQRLAQTYSVTFEYLLTQNAISSSQGQMDSAGDGAYVQFRSYVSPSFEWYARYGAFYADRNDRSGHEAEASRGSPRHQNFSREHVAGVALRNMDGWGLFAEYHYVDGTAQMPQAENQGREPERYWQKALLMLAYRF